jgi:hypothetical protein
MNKPAMKACTVCGIEKEADLSHFHGNGRGGLRGECKPCWMFKNAACHANARAKAIGRSDRLSVQDIRTVYEAANGLDYWTQAPLSPLWQIDHIVPMSAGGANSLENICITNAKTNRRKSSKLLPTWLAELAMQGYDHELIKGYDYPVQIRMKL